MSATAPGHANPRLGEHSTTSSVASSNPPIGIRWATYQNLESCVMSSNGVRPSTGPDRESGRGPAGLQALAVKLSGVELHFAPSESLSVNVNDPLTVVALVKLPCTVEVVVVDPPGPL